jgi:hypothetical protein
MLRGQQREEYDVKKYVLMAALAVAVIAVTATTSMAGTKHDGLGFHRQPVAYDVNVPVTREAAPGLPDETIYRPTDIGPGARLPVVLWENGGCTDSNGPDAVLLTRIAASGFFVIAHGPVTNLPVMLPATSPLLDPNPPLDAPAAAQPFVGTPPGYLTTVDSGVSLMESALKWAEATDVTRSSPYYQALDLSAVATSGQSCGGIVAIAAAAADPRVKAVLGYNTSSSVTDDVSDPLREALLKEHAALAWIMGGTSDIAYPGYQADWAMPFTAPAFEAEHMYAGHTGFLSSVDFEQEVAKIGIYWLDLTLNHNPIAGKYILGAPCGFCTNPYWSTKEKNWPRPWGARVGS